MERITKNCLIFGIVPVSLPTGWTPQALADDFMKAIDPSGKIYYVGSMGGSIAVFPITNGGLMKRGGRYLNEDGTFGDEAIYV